MKIQKEELMSILGQFNPWWRGEVLDDLPNWHRAVFGELLGWIQKPPVPRAVFLSGARQVGKTTLLMQAINRLLAAGIPRGNILYATFDHPILKLAGIEDVIEAWREREPRQEGPEFIFLDEVQFIRNWGTWIKHQVDFSKHRRIIFTGSATPILEKDQESGVGRWHTLRLTTLSFYEYLNFKKINLPTLPTIKSLRDITVWPETELRHLSELAEPYIAHFHNYLVHGGFPQTALLDNVPQAQKLLREDIIDKAIKRDMTVLFGVRRVIELEHVFLYLCLHDGGILDLPTLGKNLNGVSKTTIQNYIDYLEAAHLIYRLLPFGYGKEVLRGRYKIYLADAAIAPAVLLKGRSVLDDPKALSMAAEVAVLKHLFARYYKQNVRFTYWRGKRDLEVDLIAEVMGQVIPFEVKYRSQFVAPRDVEGIITFCQEKNPNRGYVITKSLGDFGPLSVQGKDVTSLFRIPAALLCYWMGETELHQQSNFE